MEKLEIVRNMFQRIRIRWIAYFLIICTVVFVSAYSSQTHDRLLALTILVSVLSVAVPLIIKLKKERPIDFFDPLTMFLAFYTCNYILKPIDSYYFPDLLYVPSSLLINILTVCLALAGLYAFYLGYFGPLGAAFSRMIPIFYTELSVTKATLFCPIMFLMGAVALTYLVLTGGGFAAYLNNLSQRVFFFKGMGVIYLLTFMMPAQGLLLYAAMVGKKYGLFVKCFLWGLMGLGAAGAAMTGSRFNVGWVVLGYVIIRNYAYKRYKLKFLVTLGCAMLIFLVIAGFLRRPGEVLEEKVEEGASRLEVTDNPFINSFHMIAKQFYPYWEEMLLVENMPKQLDFQYGMTYLGPPFLFMPKFILEDKALYAVQMGKIYSTSFFPDSWTQGITYSPGLIGEGYINFGVVGVIVSFFVMGVFYKGLYIFMLDNPQSKGRLLLYAVLNPQIGRVLKGGFSPAQVDFICMGMFVFFVGMILKKKRRGGLGVAQSPRRQKFDTLLQS